MPPGKSDLLLEQGIVAFKAKRKAEARRLVGLSLYKDPANEKAWLWMAALVEEPERKKECFERALALNPNNRNALIGLEKFADTPQIPEPLQDLPTPETGVEIKLGNMGTSFYPAPDEVINAEVREIAPEETGLAVIESGKTAEPTASDKKIARAQGKTHKLKSLYEPYVLTDNGRKLLARHIYNGSFALYSADSQFKEQPDHLIEDRQEYHRTPANLKNIALASFLEQVGNIPEAEALDLILSLCDNLLAYYPKKQAKCWLGTGAHGLHDITVSANGELEPDFEFVDAPAPEYAHLFLPPEYNKRSDRDQRSDEFTVCAILYFMITADIEGLTQYRNRGRALLFEHNGHSLERKLVKTLERGLALTPQRRFPNFQALRDELAVAHRKHYPTRRNWLWGVAAALVVALVAGAIIGVSQNWWSFGSKAETVVLASTTENTAPLISATAPVTTFSSPTATNLHSTSLPSAAAVAPVTATSPQTQPGRLLLQQFNAKEPLITLFFNALNRDNKPVQDIKSQGLRLYLEGRELTVMKLEQTVEPLTALFALDTSDNMTVTVLNHAKDSINQISASFSNKSKLGLLRYAVTAEIAVELGGDPTKIAESLKNYRPNGANATFDALLNGVEQFKGSSGRKALVLFTAGGDNFSPVTRPSFILDRLLEYDVNLYVVSYRPTPQTAASLRQMAEMTGGYYAEAQNENELSLAQDSLKQLLSHPFKLSFNLAGQPDASPVTPIAGQKRRLVLQYLVDDALVVAAKLVE
ncbi:VWA domain-containing protein [Candidatus Chlorohelix sp.]|uniref:VWA domain-containing protein n=1 Tax=Candidatus Chlorohelix sp. TaxID=3139201 RepID=UPI003028619F